MKKYLFIMSAAALAMASCSEEQELVNAPVNQANRVLTATFEQDAATRTNIATEGNALTWSEGDAIAVFGPGDGDTKYNLTDGAGEISATFTLDGEESTAPEEIEGAAFPHNQANWSDGALIMNLLANLGQTTAGELDLPMWGTVTDGNIAFKHLAGVLKVNLTDVPEGYTKLIVTASNPISGNFTATKIEEELVLTSNSTKEEDKTVTVTFTNAEGPTLYLPLPVGTYESIVVSVSDGDAKAKVLKKFSDLKVERTKVYKTTVSDYTSVMNGEELVAAITAGGEVTLGADVTLDESISIAEGNTVTVNLNGKTLTLNETIVNAGNLTFSNGNIVADGTAVRSNSGSLTMTDCQVTGGETVVYVTGGTAAITGGSYNNSNSADDNTSAYCIAVDGENTTVTINTTVNKDVTEGVYKGGVTVRYGATVDITGGEYYGNLSKSQHGLHAVVGANVTYAEGVSFNEFYVQAISMAGNTLEPSTVNEASFGTANFIGNKETMDAKIAEILAAEE